MPTCVSARMSYKCKSFVKSMSKYMRLCIVGTVIASGITLRVIPFSVFPFPIGYM